MKEAATTTTMVELTIDWDEFISLVEETRRPRPWHYPPHLVAWLPDPVPVNSDSKLTHINPDGRPCDDVWAHADNTAEEVAKAAGVWKKMGLANQRSC